MKRKVCILLVLILCLTNVIGCVSYDSLGKLAFVNCIVLDVKDNKFVINYMVSNSNTASTNNAGKSFSIITADGKNIGECIDKAESQIEKKIFWGSLNCTVFSKKFLQNKTKLKEFLDFSEKDPLFDFSSTVQALDAEADEFIQLFKDKEPQADEFMNMLISKNPSKEYWQTKYYTTIIKNGDFILPLIQLKDKMISYEGIGVIQNFEYKMKLNQDESGIYYMLTKEIVDAYTETPYGQVKILSTRFAIEDLDFSKIHYKLNLQCETITYKGKVLDKKTATLIEKHLEREIEERCRLLWNKVQHKEKVDLFEMQEYLYKLKYKEYKQKEKEMNHIIPQIKLDIDVKADLKRSGITY